MNTDDRYVIVPGTRKDYALVVALGPDGEELCPLTCQGFPCIAGPLNHEGLHLFNTRDETPHETRP